MKLALAQAHLRSIADPAIAKQSLRYFKTGKGEYSEGDVFLGIRMPSIRDVAKQHRDLAVAAILNILRSDYHEERMLALLLLVYQFEKGDDSLKKEIYEAYLRNTRYVSGWDLVDGSAHQIVGGYLLDRSRNKLLTLSKSKMLWERRISVIATFHFIRRNQFEDTLQLSKKLLNDKEDLIHKAVGWMLREVGSRDKKVETHFLNEHGKDMPRTMLRYAIEKFDKKERDHFMGLGS